MGDPVRYGLIASLAKPGGNVTGLSFQISEMMLKNLELLKEVAPRTARVAFLSNPSNPGTAPTMADLKRAAPALGISVIQVEAAYAAVRFMDAGGLMAMAPNIADAPRLVASYVDRLLKGAKASDLPVEQPSKFELVINAKAAKAFGLTLPQSLLQRADRVIE